MHFGDEAPVRHQTGKGSRHGQCPVLETEFCVPKTTNSNLNYFVMKHDLFSANDRPKATRGINDCGDKNSDFSNERGTDSYTCTIATYGWVGGKGVYILTYKTIKTAYDISSFPTSSEKLVKIHNLS